MRTLSYWELMRGDKNLPILRAGSVFFQMMLHRAFLRENWSGIYKSVSELPPAKEAFERGKWLYPLYLSAKLVKNSVEKGKPIPEKYRHDFLVSITQDLLKKNENLRIVDLGGGMGGAYLYLVSAGSPASKIRYFVMEVEAVSQLASPLLASHENLSFHAAPITEFQEADMVYISSALQYFEDFRKTLRMIAGWKARHLVMDRLAAGGIPTFLTRQKTIPGASIPYWFINRDELIEVLGGEYTLEHEEDARPVEPMENFPEKYRLSHYRRMHFKRK